jgi:hypothetical protein
MERIGGKLDYTQAADVVKESLKRRVLRRKDHRKSFS